MKKTWILSGFVGVIIGLWFGIKLGYDCYRTQVKEIDYSTPVEESRIDTLYITRDKYHTIVKHIDSVKHDTIQKVYNLDDSTTLQLFLQLVSE